MIARWGDQAIGSRLDYQQVLDADPKAIQQISFTDNLEDRETNFFSWRNHESIVNLFCFNKISIKKTQDKMVNGKLSN